MSTAPVVVAPRAAAIYCRISQDRTGQGLGVGRQESDCRAWAERSGWAVAEVYIDDDLSAYSGKPRPAYRRLLADIESCERDGLVVWHPDRLHRSPAELEAFIDVVERTSIAVGTVTAGDLDLTTATGRMTARIVGAVARHESDHKSERIRRKHLELAENGRVPGGGRRPFGYEADRVTIREDEAEMIREAAGRTLAGEGLRTICKDWASRGISTVTGAQWSTTTLRRLLSSGRIVGWREHHGRMVAKAEWPAILDEVTGKRLRRLLDDPGRSTVDTTARSYLLAGMVRCGACGAVMVARPVMRKGHRYRRYACIVDKGGCNRVGIGAEPLETLITDAVLLRLAGAAFPEMSGCTKDRSSSTSVDEIEERLDELAEMFAAGEITRPEWAKAREGLMKRLREAKARAATEARSEAVAARLARPDVVRQEWPRMSLDARRAVLAALVEHITIAPTTKAGNKFNPDRVDVTWKV